MLSLTHITKRFARTTALSDVSVTFAPGRVHGVLGENGAGKTTLMRIAAGIVPADAGRVTLNDTVMTPGSAITARRAGVAMVHQHFSLVPTLTVAENAVLGRREAGLVMHRRQVAEALDRISRRVGLDVDPWARVETLSVGERQRAEIVRALAAGGRVLILDEPTAVLTPQETENLFAALRRLRTEQHTIIFISHKLHEVAAICDELTVLRQGRTTYEGPAAALSNAELAERMVGTNVPALRERCPMSPAAPIVLQLADVSAYDEASSRRIERVDLTVRGGEIVGIAGVEGNGQDVLAGAVVGVVPIRKGSLTLAGADVTRAPVRTRHAQGLAHIAEDRLNNGLIASLNLRANLAVKAFRDPPLARHGWLRRSAWDAWARDRLERFDVRPAEPDAEVLSLSGGNQQKLLLARELGGKPTVVVAQNPVRGLDLRASRFVWDQLLAQRQRGAGILLIHSDLDELLAVADRVLVMAAGRCIATDWPAMSRPQIGRLMLGADNSALMEDGP